MDLLYNNGRYEDVVKVFDVVEARQNQGTRYPRSVVMLYVAALYKMVRFVKNESNIIK